MRLEVSIRIKDLTTGRQMYGVLLHHYTGDDDELLRDARYTTVRCLRAFNESTSTEKETGNK